MKLSEGKIKELESRAVAVLLPQLSGRWALEAAKRFFEGDYGVIFDTPPEPEDFEASSVCWGWFRRGQRARLPFGHEYCIASFGNGENTEFPLGLTFWFDCPSEVADFDVPQETQDCARSGEVVFDEEDTIIVDGEDL